MNKFRVESWIEQRDAHMKAWLERAPARDAILAQYGVTCDMSRTRPRFEGTIMDVYRRSVRLGWSEVSGWEAGTSGTITDLVGLERFHMEAMEVLLCIKALHAIGDVGGMYPED